MSSPSTTPTETTQRVEDGSTNTHLSFPSFSTPPPDAGPSEKSRPVLRERLYVGNLHPSVDEYTLLQVFTKFGTVNKLDFLFHKTGPLKGKPRGYAFVEYADPNDAERALTAAHDKLLRGRKLVVTHAHQAPLDQAGGTGLRYKRMMNDAGKPTTLSLLKSAGTGRADATDAKIAKMEEKLRQMEHESSTGTSTSKLHPSLPAKPAQASFSSAAAPSLHRMSSSASSTTRPKKTQTPLPSLPLSNPTTNPSGASPILFSGASMPRKPAKTLTGVRIVKKDK